MAMTKTQKRNMLEAIRVKSIKLYIDGLMSTNDVEAISRIVERNKRKLK